MPSNITDSPCPPASTTPASRSTASIVGVLETALSASSPTRPSISPIDCPSDSDSAAARAIQSITVSIVPSTGSATALYAAVLASARAFDNSAVPSVSEPSRPTASPLKNWERMMPLLPLASIIAARDITAAASPAERPPEPSSAFTTASSVRNMFVPVSPSGTGKTLSELMTSTLALSRSAAKPMYSRSCSPVMVSGEDRRVEASVDNCRKSRSVVNWACLPCYRTSTLHATRKAFADRFEQQGDSSTRCAGNTDGEM